MPLAHLVPVIARQLQLGLHRQFDLGQGHQVLKSRLTRNFLSEEPFHLGHGSVLGQPRKQRITLAGSRLLERFEPAHKSCRLRRHVGRLRSHLNPFALDEAALHQAHLRFLLNRSLPLEGLECGGEPSPVEAAEAAVECLGILFANRWSPPWRDA
jgi:hypothetical protein